MKAPGAGHEAPGALDKGLFPFRLAEYAGRKVHAEEIRPGIAPAQQFQAVSHAATGVEHAMRPAADVVEPLEHAPLDFPLEHRGVAARRCGKSSGACSRSEEHTSELQSQSNLVCRLLLEKKKNRESTSDCRIHAS